MEPTQVTDILHNIHDEIIKATFNDVQIFCEDGKTTSSRIALAALSPFFLTMLTADMREKRTGVVHLPSISLSIFQDILRICFCKEDLVNEDNWTRILDAAEMMQLPYVKEQCFNFLKDSLKLTTDNCLNCWRIMNKYDFIDLSERVFRFLIENLSDFGETESAVLLSKEECVEIISNEELECNETDVVKLVMKWIERNNPELEDVTEMFGKLKLDFVDPDFLINEVAFSDIVFRNNSVKKMIQSHICTHMTSSRNKSRMSSKGVDVYVLQCNGKSLLSRFTTDNKWEDVPPAPEDIEYWYSAVSWRNKIYITGGGSNLTHTLIYDISRNVWQTGPHLKHGRQYHCMATAGHKLYAVGGRCTSIEELSEDATQWQIVGDLKHTRDHAFAVTVGHNILIMGGLIGSVGSDIIQCFHATSHSVTTLSTRLPYSSNALRGSVHLPDVYLLDYDGNVMHLQITDRDGQIQIKTLSTTKWKSFTYCYGVMHHNGKLLCFNKNGISTFNIAKNQEEENDFPKPTRSGEVSDIIPVFR